MADLDGLIGSKISLISQEDVKFDGTLFSINAEESSMVLKQVVCLGTEDRVKDPAKKIPPNPTVIPLVTFPGSEIKDLIVHDTTAPAAPQQQQHKQTGSQNKNSVKPPAPPANDRPKKHQQNTPAPTAAQIVAQGPKKEVQSSGAGTGAHLLKLREKKAQDGTASSSAAETTGDFDFSAGLSMFKKDDVLAKVAEDADNEVKYRKDDFFDSLSCDTKDRQEGRKTRLTASEERSLNQDTFGAIALQGSRRHYGGRGGRGGGRGGRGGGRGNRNYGNGVPKA